MGIANVIGEAEIIIRPNTATFKSDLGKEVQPGLSGLESDAATSGEKAGDAAAKGLSGHLSKGLSGLGKIVENATGISGLSKPFDKAAEGAKGLEKDAGGLVGTLTSIGKVATVGVAAGLAVALGAAAHFGMQMQSTDASLAASAGISLKAATDIGNAQLKISAGSVYTGQELTKAYGGIAGELGAVEGHSLSAAESTQVMTAAMDLAEGTGHDLTSTTQDIANVMQAYHLSVGQAAAATDVMYATSKSTGVGIDQLTATVQRLHASMGAAAPPIGQVGALIVDMAQHGETGRQATAALGSAFTGLLTPSAAVAKAQHDLGVEFINSKTGALEPVGKIIAELGPKIAGMGDAQATATLKAVGFGNAAGKLVSVIQAGPQVFDKLTKSVDMQGSAHQAAAVQAQSLSHEVEALKVDAEDLATEVGQAVVPVMQRVFGVLTNVATVIIRNKPLLIGLAAAIGGTLVVAMGTFAAAAVADMSTVDIALAGIPIAIGLIVTGVLLLKDHWKEAWADIKGAFVDAANFIIRIYNDTIGKMHINIFGHTIGATQIGSLADPNAAPSGVSAAGGASSTVSSSAQIAKMTGEKIVAVHAAATKQTTDNVTKTVAGATGPVTAQQVAAAKQQATSAKAAESAATKEEKARTTAVTKAAAEQAKRVELVHKTGLADLNQLVKAAHTGSLAQLNTLLNNAHKGALTDLEKKLLAEHTTEAKSLETKLVAAQNAALTRQTQQQAAALATQTQNARDLEATALGIQTAAASDAAAGQATQIADQTKLALDTAAEAGLSGADLVAAQAQVTLDQITQTTDAAITAAKIAVDNAAGGDALTKETAAAAQAGVEGQASIDKANAQASLDLANAAASAAASAATNAATGASTTTAGTVVQLTVQPGAVVITPAPGNDAASLSATQGYVVDAFSALVQELEAGLDPLNTLTV